MDGIMTNQIDNNDLTIGGSVLEQIKLVRFMSEAAYFNLRAGNADESKDEHRGKVSRFLQLNGLPDPTRYSCATACIEGFRSTDSVVGFGDVIGYIDFESVANDIVLVSLVDIQDAAINNQPKRVWAALGDSNNKRELVFRAIRECPNGRYPEVRISRPLTDLDFISYDTRGSVMISLMEAAKED
jgi:hypothetical protein